MDVARSSAAFVDSFVSPREPAQLPTTSLMSDALAFYSTQRFVGVVPDGGDMLLFQFGVYDWGDGPHFEVDLTRQLIEVERDGDDDVLSQFRVTCFYKPTPELQALGSDEVWCEDLSKLTDFKAFVTNHAVMSAIEPLTRERVEIGWGVA